MELLNLTAEDLKDVGIVIVGHRRKLLDAIAALRADANAKATSSDSSCDNRHSYSRNPPNAGKSQLCSRT